MIEKFIMAGDTALHICDSQKGDKVVVLLHGYLENMMVWDSFVPLLYKKVRVITLDIPGHGISVVKGECHTMDFLADVIAAGVQSLGIEKATFVGHSMGGYVAQAICENYPQISEGLVLLSSTPNADTEQKKENRKREINLIKSGKKELLAHSTPQVGFANENVGRFSDEIEDLAEIVHTTEDSGIIALLNGMITRKDYNDFLRSCNIPQLFILGCKDNYITIPIAENMVKNHPQASVVWLANSGHMGFIEQPQQTADAILKFVGVE